VTSRRGEPRRRHLRAIYQWWAPRRTPEWLSGLVKLDDKGFVITGSGEASAASPLPPRCPASSRWRCSRRLGQARLPSSVGEGSVRDFQSLGIRQPQSLAFRLGLPAWITWCSRCPAFRSAPVDPGWGSSRCAASPRPEVTPPTVGFYYDDVSLTSPSASNEGTATQRARKRSVTCAIRILSVPRPAALAPAYPPTSSENDRAKSARVRFPFRAARSAPRIFRVLCIAPKRAPRPQSSQLAHAPRVTARPIRPPRGLGCPPLRRRA